MAKKPLGLRGLRATFSSSGSQPLQVPAMKSPSGIWSLEVLREEQGKAWFAAIDQLIK